MIWSFADNAEGAPTFETFYRTKTACLANGWTTGEGWYWCMGRKDQPDSDYFGPFETEDAACEDAMRNEP